MEGANTYEPGDWVDHTEGYYFICGFCEKAGTGRQGKKFCSDKCRFRLNNRKSRKSKKESQSFYSELRHNEKILSRLIQKYRPLQWIKKSEFDLNGFIWNSARKMIKIVRQEGEWSQIGIYAYQIGHDNKVRIFKLNKP